MLLRCLEWSRERQQTGQACSLETSNLHARCALSFKIWTTQARIENAGEHSLRHLQVTEQFVSA